MPWRSSSRCTRPTPKRPTGFSTGSLREWRRCRPMTPAQPSQGRPWQPRAPSPMYSRIVGTGSYLPAHVLTNAELAKRVDTSDEWIRTRTGIRERRIAAAAEQTSDLAAHASRAALAAAGILPSELDLIVVATTTP